MEIRKAPRKDLERKRSIFLQIGFVVTLSLVLIAFEWSSTNVRVDYGKLVEDTRVVEEIVPITVHKEKVIPARPAPVDVLEITDEITDLPDPEIFIPDPTDPNLDLSNYSIPEVKEEREEVFIHVEEMPEFPGGTEALFQYLARNVHYPEIARINGVEGRVFVQFVVNKSGEITQVSILRGVNASLDREALRVVSAMPLWKPGRQNNQPVSVSFTVPINFVLENR